jgi:hypothetical protein
MSVWITTTLVVAFTAATVVVANAGSCGPKSARDCANNGQNIDLHSVPDITQKIIDEEPAIKRPTKPLNEPVPAAPYTGPIFGLTSGKRAPTVGYSWSLE